jgi:hypothetical protein
MCYSQNNVIIFWMNLYLIACYWKEGMLCSGRRQYHIKNIMIARMILDEPCKVNTL